MARKAKTLCAVMLLLICQSFIGTYAGCWTGHCEGAAQMLKARGYLDTRDDFERILVLSLRGPVLFEALLNDRICFSRKERSILVENELDGSTPEGRMMRCLARVPDLIQRGRISLRTGSSVQMLTAEARHQYHTLKEILSQLHDRYNAVRELSNDGGPQAVVRSIRLHAHYQRTYGLALSICMIVNCILNALDPNDTVLEMDSTHFRKDTLILADEAMRYRPLGASFVMLCLVVAWCGSRDEVTRATVESTMADYGMDFPGTSTGRLRADVEYVSQRLRLLET